MAAVLVEHSAYERGALKRRLYAEGLKERRCELCGQGEEWRGATMSLVLDHINGAADDNRIENLRVVCPNCNATLETHCGRTRPKRQICATCSKAYIPDRHARYCSDACRWHGHRERTGVPRPDLRRVQRPPEAQLLTEIAELGYSAVGRRYEVSDNAIRTWVRAYAAERAAAHPAD